jgi:acetyl esterase/lipase
MRRPVLTVTVCSFAFAFATLAGGPPAGAASSVTTATPSGTAPAPALAVGQQVTRTYCNHQRARITEPAALRGPAPAAVYVHGGSWISGDYDTGGFLIDTIGPELAANGFVVVSLDYRLGPKEHWPDQIVDVKCAIRYLRANARQLNIDPHEIGAWGQSAGGHLVALLGTARPSAGWDVGPYSDQSSAVEAVIDMAGPSDLLTMGDQGDAVGVAESFVSLLGRVPHHQLGADLRKASPVTYIAPGDPPFLLVQSTNDEIVYAQQTLEMAHDLGAKGVPYQVLMVQRGGHAFESPSESPNENGIARTVVDFFVRSLVFHEPISNN